MKHSCKPALTHSIGFHTSTQLQLDHQITNAAPSFESKMQETYSTHSSVYLAGHHHILQLQLNTTFYRARSRQQHIQENKTRVLNVTEHSRLAGSTWGASLENIRGIYQAAIVPMITYSHLAWSNARNITIPLSTAFKLTDRPS